MSLIQQNTDYKSLDNVATTPVYTSVFEPTSVIFSTMLGIALVVIGQLFGIKDICILGGLFLGELAMFGLMVGIFRYTNCAQHGLEKCLVRMSANAGRLMNKKSELRLMLKKMSHIEVSTEMVGVLCVGFLMLLGAILALCAWLFLIEDLYIPGAVFLIGGTLFGITILVCNCIQLCVGRRKTRKMEQDITGLERL